MDDRTGSAGRDTDEGAEARTRGAKEGILQAAVELIARDGFDGVRLADIARRAGVSNALVHYHFDSRERLLTDALAYSLTREEVRLERRTRQSHRDRPAERLADLIDFGLPLTHDDVLECRLWAELKIRSAGSVEMSGRLAEFRARLLEPLAAVVEAGLRDGVFSDCDPADVAAVAMALLEGLTHRLITETGGLTLADARRLAARQLTLAVGYSGDLPFRPLPDPGPQRIDLQAPRPRRLRAPRASSPS
ncbi:MULTISPECIES: TetR/AcrR family transcriptional regulator [Streptomyces]|uniref:TetR family transcriptional regulator n=1 Tax=Streptomyces cadmiisoli TaxID=2184053 RepID=A0A2Z4JDZ6_9ACTN|nr:MULTISPECIES: TetR/AcrR family transcriptional regulator [Streptomyces]AWW43271.1 TetR family transcriptional regulator [Streptomyces cadmiisoli]